MRDSLAVLKIQQPHLQRADARLQIFRFYLFRFSGESKVVCYVLLLFFVFQNTPCVRIFICLPNALWNAIPFDYITKFEIFCGKFGSCCRRRKVCLEVCLYFLMYGAAAARRSLITGRQKLHCFVVCCHYVILQYI